VFSIDDTCVYVVRICGAACIQAYWKMEGKLISSDPHKQHILSFL
jgi:hypothetical protein